MKKKNPKKRLTPTTPVHPELPVKGTNEVHGQGSYRFFEDVYDVVRQIPKGRVTSYGAIAAYLGTKQSARMVGWAMNAATATKPQVPAQRVVNRNGMLTGKYHFATDTAMEELLKKEGVPVKNDTIVDFKERFWDPAVELSL